MATKTREVPAPEGIREFEIEVDWVEVMQRVRLPRDPRRAQTSGTRTTLVPSPDGILMYELVVDWDAVLRRQRS